MNTSINPSINPSMPVTKSEKTLSIQIRSFSFWLVFILCYFYLSRIIIVLTYDKLPLGMTVLFICLLMVFLHQKIVKNIPLTIVVALLVLISLISAWVNNVSWLQLLAFVRILIIVYLIYNLVWYYLDNRERVVHVLRLMFLIAIVQFPVIALQRYLYPFLPDRIKYGNVTGQLSMIDFGMGTFNGDTSMAFALIVLVILLLFDRNVRFIAKRTWLLAGWLTVTILFSNSQIHHFMILFVWVIYFLTHLRIKNILIGFILVGFVIASIVLLSKSNLMTFPLIQNTINKFLSISQVLDENIAYEKFIGGSQARNEAIAYYLNQPIKWIGDGPGAVYDTATGSRTVGGWGHIFTFYAEVGIIGWLVSVLIFFVIAFPIRWSDTGVKIQYSLVQALVFLSVNIVTLVKYPMGNSAIMFTYCVILIGHQFLSRSEYLSNSIMTRRSLNPYERPGNRAQTYKNM